MTITPEEHYARELSELEAEWRSGEYVALLRTVSFCRAAELPLPEWASSAVLDELKHAYNKGRRGRSAAGRPQSNKDHLKRWRLVRLWFSPRALAALAAKGHPATKQAVCTRVASTLGNHVRWQAVRDSYDLVEDAIARGEHDRIGINDDELRWWRDRDEG